MSDVRVAGFAAVVFALALGSSPVAAQAPSAQATTQQVAAMLERGDVAGARTALAPALRSHPRDPTLHNLAGVVEAQGGAFAAAEAHFETAIRLAPQAPGAYENLGRLYQEKAGADSAMRAKAIAVYRRLLAMDPASAEGLFQAAFLLALDGRFAESRRHAERLPGEIRGRPQVLALLAVVLAGLGEKPAALRAAADLATHPELTEADVLAVLPGGRPVHDDVLRVMLEALDRRGAASRAILMPLAEIHTRAGRHAEARAALERAAAAGVTPAILLELARTAARQRDFKGALGYLAHARSLAPANAAVHFAFGIVCVELNLGREAYEALKRAVELEPDNPTVNYAMGAVATHRHEPSESLPYFEKYVQLKPDDPRGHFALGAARFYSNQFDQARAPLERAAGSPETATGAHYFLGRIARQGNDLATARREIGLALASNDRSADAWAELGLIQTRQGEHAEAERSLAKALAIDPAHYAATVNLATLFARTKDPRREAQAAKVASLLEQREARAQEFLRIIQAVP